MTVANLNSDTKVRQYYSLCTISRYVPTPHKGLRSRRIKECMRKLNKLFAYLRYTCAISAEERARLNIKKADYKFEE